MKRILTLFLVCILVSVAQVVPVNGANVNFTAIDQAASRAEDINFRDAIAEGVDFWARKAVFEMAALGVIKGDNGNFMVGSAVTRSQALAFIQRAVGLSGRADSAKLQVDELREQEPVTMVDSWADGHIRLAYDLEWITEQQYQDALNPNQASVASRPDGFIKDGGAQRQEIITWLCKAIGTPLLNTTAYVSKYQDADDIDVDKIRFVETGIHRKIMVGSDNMLYPRDTITREQMVQVLKNCDYEVYAARGVYRGEAKVTSTGEVLTMLNAAGDTLSVSLSSGKGLVVLTVDGVYDQSALREGDNVEYLFTQELSMFFVNVLNDYKGSDSQTQSGQDDDFDIENSAPPDVVANGVVSGVVASINFLEQTIVLYEETGVLAEDQKRVYRYVPLSELSVIKNGAVTTVSSVKADDHVFLRLNENGEVTAIASDAYFVTIYASLVSQGDGVIEVLDRNGIVQSFMYDRFMQCSKEQTTIPFHTVPNGSNLKLRVEFIRSVGYVRSCVVEVSEHIVRNVYKMKLNSYQELQRILFARDVRKMENGQFARSSVKGFTQLTVLENTRLTDGKTDYNLADINSKFVNYDAYVAVTEDPVTKQERICFIMLSSSAESTAQVLFGAVDGVYLSPARISIGGNSGRITLREGALVIKDGKISPLGTVSSNDSVSLIADKISGNSFVASVIMAQSGVPSSRMNIYYGSVEKIELNGVFQILCSERYDGTQWMEFTEYRTFTPTDQTQFLSLQGIIRAEKFSDKASDSGQYPNFVQVLVIDNNVVAVSESEPSKNEVTGTVGTIADLRKESGYMAGSIAKYAEVYIYDTTTYNNYSGRYSESNPGTLTIFPNTIIIKNNTIIPFDNLRLSDRVRVLSPVEWSRYSSGRVGILQVM